MGKILAILLPLLALAAGGAAGHFLRPPEPEPEVADGVPPEAEAPSPDATAASVTFRDGFVVPVLRSGRMWTHMVLTLGVESRVASAERILALEPVLRDALTEALFLHGAVGDFDGDFTDPMAMNRLRTRLNAAVRTALGDPDGRVLIVALVRRQV